MKPPATNSEKVPRITKFAYGAGDIGPAIATAIMSFFLLYFFTDVARMSPFLVSILLAVGKLWDAINDPIVGMLSDRIHTRWGRRRPWFLFGAIPFGVSFFLLFLVPLWGEAGKFLYFFVIMLVLDTAFTVVNVPYAALTAELTRDYDERTSLNSYRFAFSITAALLAAFFHPMIVNAVKPIAGEQMGYLVSALIWAVVCTVPFFFAFWGTYERHTPEEEAPMPFVEGLKTTFGNVPFRYVTGIYLVSWLVVQTVSTLVIYYLTYWLRRPEQTPFVLLAVQGSALIFLFVWTAASRRIGKKGVYYLGMIWWIIVSFLLFIVQPAWSPSVILVLGFFAGIGVAAAYLVPWAMLPDVIELDELKTGRRREGAFYGFFVFLQKAGLALGLALVSLTLGLSGYINPPPGTTTPIVQPDTALFAIRLMIGPIPAIILAAGIYLVYKFPISKADHEAMVRELDTRKAASDAQGAPSLG
jgi:GPH family glycoside/pentoside/hexuronide:cation symporter